MDPLSVTAACVGLLSGLISVSTKIRGMSADIKNTYKEIVALQSELDSCQRSLGLFYGSGQADRYPEALRADLEKIIRECKHVVDEIDRLLEKVTSASLSGRVQWSISIRDEVTRLHRNLEGHKSALSIAIAFASMSISSGIKSDTSSIRSKAARIPEIQQQLAALVDAIQSLGDGDPAQGQQLGLAMQRFLEEAYTESIGGSVRRSATVRSYDHTVPSIVDPFEDPRTQTTSTGAEQYEHEIDAHFDDSSSATLSTPFSQEDFLRMQPQPLLSGFANPPVRPDLLSPVQTAVTRKPVPLRSKSEIISSTISSDSLSSRTPSETYNSDRRSTMSSQRTSSRGRPWWQLRSRSTNSSATLVSSEPFTFELEISHQKLDQIASLLAADVTEFKNDPSFHEYKTITKDLYARTLVLAPSTRNAETQAAFKEAVELHQAGQASLAFERARYLAQIGHLSSQIMYALALRYGRGCRVDAKMSLAYLYTAARVSIELELRSRSAAPYFTDLAARDELSLALLEIANTFRYTWAESVSAVDARLFYRAAADVGDVKAMEELAWCYLKGFGTEKDKWAAAQILQEAERRGLRGPGREWIYKEKYKVRRDRASAIG